MPSQRNNTDKLAATATPAKRKPTRRERRLQADANDWRAALRDAAPLLRVHRAFV